MKKETRILVKKANAQAKAKGKPVTPISPTKPKASSASASPSAGRSDDDNAAAMADALRSAVITGIGTLMIGVAQESTAPGAATHRNTLRVVAAKVGKLSTMHAAKKIAATTLASMLDSMSIAVVNADVRTSCARSSAEADLFEHAVFGTYIAAFSDEKERTRLSEYWTGIAKSEGPKDALLIFARSAALAANKASDTAKKIEEHEETIKRLREENGRLRNIIRGVESVSDLQGAQAVRARDAMQQARGTVDGALSTLRTVMSSLAEISSRIGTETTEAAQNLSRFIDGVPKPTPNGQRVVTGDINAAKIDVAKITEDRLDDTIRAKLNGSQWSVERAS